MTQIIHTRKLPVGQYPNKNNKHVGINIISPCNLANVTLISTCDANQSLLIIDRMDHWINYSQ